MARSPPPLLPKPLGQGFHNVFGQGQADIVFVLPGVLALAIAPARKIQIIQRRRRSVNDIGCRMAVGWRDLVAPRAASVATTARPMPPVAPMMRLRVMADKAPQFSFQWSTKDCRYIPWSSNPF